MGCLPALGTLDTTWRIAREEIQRKEPGFIMLAFHTLYRPLTSRPFMSGLSYKEYAPCEALRSYIVCFWGTEWAEADHADELPRPVLVNPDTCFDIIIKIDHARQALSCRLCGIQDVPVMVEQSGAGVGVTSFAVRFHFWAASLFFNFSLREVYNQVFDLELVRPGSVSQFLPLIRLGSMRERIIWMEEYLLKKMDFSRYNPNVYNSIDSILRSCGRTSVKEICQYSCVSQRQMERLFLQEVGISVKRTLSLVRYQNVWQDIVCQEKFDAQEAVFHYGYSDQSHMLNEFRRFHGVSPEQAKSIAMESR